MKNNNSLKIPRDQLALIARGYKDAGWTNEHIAVQTGYSEKTIRRALKETGYVNPNARAITPPKEQPSKDHYKVLETLHIKNKDVAICSDIHLPTTRYDWLDNFTAQAKQYGIKELVIAGDLFDMSKLNRHDKEWGEGRNFEHEMSEGNRILKLWLEVFDRITILRGNHDVNYVRNLQWQVSFASSMRMILNELTPEQHKRITIVDNDHCYIHNKQGQWLVAHTYQFSRISGKVPSDIAMVEKECVGVIGAHRHHYGIINAPNGSLAVEAGHFSDSEQLEFIKRHKSTMGKTAKGGGVFLFKESPYLPLLAPLPERIMTQYLENEQ